MRSQRIHAIIQKACENPNFAVDFIRNPEAYRSEFNLQAVHVAELKAIESGDVDKIWSRSPAGIRGKMLALVIAAVFRFAEDRASLRELLPFEEIVRIARAHPRVAGALMGDLEKYRDLFNLSYGEIEILKTFFSRD
jgi:hypothetical protein